MPRLFRLLALGLPLVFSALTALYAQPTYNSSLPVPETYFPALKGILASAVSQSPRMVARNAENAVAEGNRIVMRAGLLPSFGGYANYMPYDRQVRSDLPEATNVNRLNYNFSITQPLFHWGALQNNNRIGQLQLRMTEGLTAEGYRLLVQEIRGQYLGLVLKKNALARAQLSLKIAQDNFAVSQTKFEKKVISEADMFMPTVNRDQAQLAIDRATEDYANIKSVFAKLCGVPVLEDSAIPDEIPDVSELNPAFEPMLASYTSQQEPDSYALKNLGDQIEVEKLNYKNISTRLYPKLNLLLGTSQDQQSYSTNIANKYQVTDYFVGLQLNWTIFDGFAQKGSAAASLARRRQLEQSFKDTAANLPETARSQYKQVGYSRRSMEIANRILVSSTGALRDKKADAGRGLASETDVNTTRLSYEDTRINAYTARSDYLMKSAEFLSTLQQDPALANLPK